MKQIPLTRGKFALVDDEDYDYLNQWKWWYTTRGYAVREEKRRVIFMHRFLMNTPDGFDTDHINRNKLDNRKENLGIVTKSQNFMNINPRKNNKSGVKGVQKNKNSWMARIKVGYRSIYLGTFLDKQDAIKARLDAEIVYHII
jgi:hypothetical protein